MRKFVFKIQIECGFVPAEAQPVVKNPAIAALAAWENPDINWRELNPWKREEEE